MKEGSRVSVTFVSGTGKDKWPGVVITQAEVSNRYALGSYRFFYFVPEEDGTKKVR